MFLIPFGLVRLRHSYPLSSLRLLAFLVVALSLLVSKLIGLLLPDDTTIHSGAALTSSSVSRSSCGSTKYHLLLRYASNVAHCSFRTEGCTLAIPTFGVQPRLLVGDFEKQHQTSLNCADLLTTVRREYELIVAVPQANWAKNTAAPNEMVADITPGNGVLVKREKKSWDGPYTFLYRDRPLPVVLDSKGVEHLLHNSMQKSYARPYLPFKDLLNPVDDTGIASQTELNSDLAEMVHDENDKCFLLKADRNSMTGLFLKMASKLSIVQTYLNMPTLLETTLCLLLRTQTFPKSSSKLGGITWTPGQTWTSHC